MTTKIHNPQAVHNKGKIYLKYWDREEPNIDSFGYIPNYSIEYADWLASAKIVPFREQQEIIWHLRSIYDSHDPDFDDARFRYWKANGLDEGIPLDSIADRLEVVDGAAIIHPVPEQVKSIEEAVKHPRWNEFVEWCNKDKKAPTSDNPYQELINLVVSNYGKQMGEVIEIIKKQFKVEKR